MHSSKFIPTQLVKLVFQLLLYVFLFATFFVMLSITNPAILNISRTAASTMATFGLTMMILTMIYGGFRIGVKKKRTVFANIALATVITDIITYIQLQIMNVNPANPEANDHLMLLGEDFMLLISAMVLQLGLMYFFISIASYFYFKINPPLNCLIITSSQEQANHVAVKLATFRQNYRLRDVIHYECADVKQTILSNDIVFLAGIPDTEEAQLESFCYQHSKGIYLMAEFEDVIKSTAEQAVLDDMPFLYMHRTEPTLMQLAGKRGGDILLSALGVIAFGLPMLFTALILKCSHNGSVLFRQKRATINGRVFEILKFRTMYISERDEEPNVSARQNDERVTRFGSFLRKYRIDELPQLFNVLRGDMSIVGPRPEMLENVERYTREVPEFRYRQQMKAGLTGLAQIEGKYNTSPKDKAILDLLYIENFSLAKDCKLMLRTLTVFFRRDSTEGFGSANVKCLKMRVEPLEPKVKPSSSRRSNDANPMSEAM